MKTTILLWLLTWLGFSAAAHDPYEITSVAYLYSNRIELYMEMEFPTGMRLAGQNPVRDVAVISQFEAALPQLRELAGGFYAFTAGNNLILPLATNVELGVENHIKFQVQFAPTPYRPFKFVARGLGPESSENPFGTSLTVLDMVNQKVLGQTTLFAGTPTAEFPPKPAETSALEKGPANAPAPSTADPRPQTNTTPGPVTPAAQALSPGKPNWVLILVTLSAVFLVTFACFRRRE